MQEVTQYWDETNRAAFVNRAFVTININSAGLDVDIYSSDLISFSHIKSGDPLSGSITQDKIVFVVNNTGGKLDYDAASDRNVYENAMCTVHESFVVPSDPVENETIDGGIYYVSEIKELKRGQQYQFTAVSVLGLMAEKANQSISQSANCEDLVDYVISQMIASDAIPVDSNYAAEYDASELQGITVDYRSGTDNYSLAEVLQLVSAMSDNILYVDRKGKIHIEKSPTTYDDYSFPENTMYKPIEVEFVQRIGNVIISSDHGNTNGGTSYTGDKIGGKQYVTLPILDDYLILGVLAESIYGKLANGRRRFKLTCRFDPKLDIFDAITIPYGGKNYSAIITGINAVYNGGWKADITAMSYGEQIEPEEE